MTHEEFMDYATAEVGQACDAKRNRLMNLVKLAWAEGKRHTETDGVIAVVMEAFSRMANGEMAGAAQIAAEDRAAGARLIPVDELEQFNENAVWLETPVEGLELAWMKIAFRQGGPESSLGIILNTFFERKMFDSNDYGRAWRLWTCRLEQPGLISRAAAPWDGKGDMNVGTAE